ncbi:hypothetical protein AURDEDRAFT_163755 [Auricularia subglabra TFB-10046 SS5]|nr:hypothetical protein AURDEDRAFT_163755 [Auricularia subglabra TFB-10046 SS5]
MPLDVVALILAYLPQADLRRASTASRIFYEAAHAAGLTLHINLVTLNTDRLENFILVVEYALAHRLQFKLALTLLVVWRHAERAVFQWSLNHTLAAIRSAMPRLVSLRATFAGHFAEAVYGGLTESAPLLRELEFLQTGALHVPIPPTLFAGLAPRLQVLTLDIPTLKPVWPHVPALDHVRALTIRLGHADQRFVLPRFFHNLKKLTIISMHHYGSAIIDISRMTLQRLTVDNDACRSLQLHAQGTKIAAVEYMLEDLQYDERFWTAGDSELMAQIQSGLKVDKSDGHIGTVVAVSSTNGAWRHTQYTSPASRRPTITLMPLGNLPPLSRLLVALTIDEAMLPQLVRTPLTLAVLRELFVDCTRFRNAPPVPLLVGPGWTEPPLQACLLQCPALALVAAFATSRAPVAIDCPNLVTLGRLLGQTSPRAALVLVRVTVGLEKHRQEHREALEKVFSSVLVDDLEELWVPRHHHPRHYDPRRTE